MLFYELQTVARIWFWIAVGACILSTIAMGLAFHIELETQCPPELLREHRLNTPVYAALIFSVFTVFFFIRIGAERSIAQINELLDPAYPHFHLIHERIPLTTAHLLVHAPIFMFCAVTLAAPVFAFASLPSVAMICQPH
jgi:hypothetical protein